MRKWMKGHCTGPTIKVGELGWGGGKEGGVRVEGEAGGAGGAGGADGAGRAVQGPI